jgi:hypothetical protein
MSSAVPGFRVASDPVTAIGWVENDLYVEYRPSDGYVFRGVSQEMKLHLATILAGQRKESIGKFVNLKIRLSHPGIRVPGGITWQFGNDAPPQNLLRATVRAVMAPDPVWSF